MRIVYPIDIDATMTEDSGNFTDGYRFNNGAIDFAVTGVADTERIKYLFSSSVNPTYLAIYVSSGSGSVIIKRTASKTTVSTTALSTGWNVIAISSTASDQWYLEFTSVSSLEINEAFFAYGFEFPYRYEPKNTHTKEYGVDLKTTQGGGEYTNKRHGPKFIKGWKNKSYSETNQSDYWDMLDAIDGIRAKVLWYDDSAYHWIRFDKIPVFTEDTYEAYSFSHGVRQQLI